MKVNDGKPGSIRPERSREPEPPHILPVGKRRAEGPPKVERPDRVEISAAGRAKAARVAPVSPESADRIAQIRRRVLEGAYNVDAVVADVARKIAKSGDL